LASGPLNECKHARKPEINPWGGEGGGGKKEVRFGRCKKCKKKKKKRRFFRTGLDKKTPKRGLRRRRTEIIKPRPGWNVENEGPANRGSRGKKRRVVVMFHEKNQK